MVNDARLLVCDSTVNAFMYDYRSIISSFSYIDVFKKEKELKLHIYKFIMVLCYNRTYILKFTLKIFIYIENSRHRQFIPGVRSSFLCQSGF